MNKNTMPRGVKTILVINTLLILTCVYNIFFMQSIINEGVLSVYILWTLLGGLIFTQVFLLTKWRKAWALTRAILYVVALLQALSLLILSRYFMSWFGALAMIFTLLLIFYLIGVRGYLNSENFRKWLLV